jgi:hypothetical protein
VSAKCTVRDGKFVEPCGTLSTVTEYAPPTGKRKGIYAWVLGSISTGPTRTFFGVKSGAHIAKGMLFNFCPFCGEKIDAPFADSSPSQEADDSQPAVGGAA